MFKETNCTEEKLSKEDITVTQNLPRSMFEITIGVVPKKYPYDRNSFCERE